MVFCLLFLKNSTMPPPFEQKTPGLVCKLFFLVCVCKLLKCPPKPAPKASQFCWVGFAKRSQSLRQTFCWVSVD